MEEGNQRKPRKSQNSIACGESVMRDSLQEHQTISAIYYCGLLDQVKLQYRPKRRDSDTAYLTQQKLVAMHWGNPWSFILQPLSPCDFHVWTPQTIWKSGNIRAQLLVTRPDSFYENGMKKLLKRWEIGVIKGGKKIICRNLDASYKINFVYTSDSFIFDSPSYTLFDRNGKKLWYTEISLIPWKRIVKYCS